MAPSSVTATIRSNYNSTWLGSVTSTRRGSSSSTSRPPTSEFSPVSRTPLRVPVVRETTLLAPGGAVSFASREIRTSVYLGGERQMRGAVLDTGAPACILPRRVWTTLDARGDIVWLTESPARFAGSGNVAHTTVFGGHYQYRL